MNLTHLGDALDHWKGSLFACLEQGNALHNFAVDAMATDADPWRPSDLKLYARLLHVEPGRILPHKAMLEENRKAYFGEIAHDGDLFLDPDTGINTSCLSPARRYVKPEEVAHLLQSVSRRVVAVYQHGSRQTMCDRVDCCVAAVAKKAPVAWCSYESPNVSCCSFLPTRCVLDESPKRSRDLWANDWSDRVTGNGISERDPMMNERPNLLAMPAPKKIARSAAGLEAIRAKVDEEKRRGNTLALEIAKVIRETKFAELTTQLRAKPYYDELQRQKKESDQQLADLNAQLEQASQQPTPRGKQSKPRDETLARYQVVERCGLDASDEEIIKRFDENEVPPPRGHKTWAAAWNRTGYKGNVKTAISKARRWVREHDRARE